ncbi:hypothetical protein QMK95_29680, partial [Klebsiella pneumoniae]|uniref:hypothetical protein n=1 Tax=Klebsiella pneumoniae TaxID=573 RepID=UPI003A86835C
PQFKALMQVMNEITGNRVPLVQPHELAAQSTLRKLQWIIDDSNALDDSDLIDTCNQARIEIKYLCSIITDLREALAARDTDIRILQDRSNYQSAEIQRLENQVYRAN